MEQGVQVLIIEDDPDISNYFESVIELFFGSRVQLVIVDKVEDVKSVFDRLIEEGLDMVFVDACLGSKTPNSMPAVRYIAGKFKGPLCAMSGNKEYLAPLLNAGANDFCDKASLAKKIDSHLRAIPRVS